MFDVTDIGEAFVNYFSILIGISSITYTFTLVFITLFRLNKHITSHFRNNDIKYLTLVLIRLNVSCKISRISNITQSKIFFIYNSVHYNYLNIVFKVLFILGFR